MNKSVKVFAAFCLLAPVLVFNTPLPVNTAGESSAHIPAYENHSLLHVALLTGDELRQFRQCGFDIVRRLPDGGFEVVATAADRERLMDLFGARLVIENLEEHYRQGLDNTQTMGGYHTFQEAYDEILAAVTTYSELADLDTIGYSIEGRPIFAVKISDNVDIDEDEAEVFINSLIHAREPITIEIVLHLMNYLLENSPVPYIAGLINNAEIWLVPVVNPDGYVYNETEFPEGGGMWRKNRRDNGDGSYGVDLNRNWGFNWGWVDFCASLDPSSLLYRGTAPFCEPEVQVLRDFCNAHDFAVVVDYHCYGPGYLDPWGFHAFYAPADHQILGSMVVQLSGLNGYPYNPFFDFIGNCGMALDWHYGEQFSKKKSMAFIVEVGGESFWPPPWMIPNLVSENLMANFFFIEEAQRIWDRPTRSLATEFYAQDDTVTLCADDYSHVVEFWNVDTEVPFNVEVSYHDSTANPGWFSVDSYSGTIAPQSSFTVELEFSPKSVSGPVGLQPQTGYLQLVLSNEEMPPDIDTLRFPVRVFVEIDDSDGDGDGVVGICDNCPETPNPEQHNNDDDQYGDLCDNCPEATNPDQADGDEDDVGNLCDNCPETYNPGQEDFDGDNIGNACEDCDCSVWGDVTGDGEVNPVDIVYMVQYAYLNNDIRVPPVECPREAGDINCDGAVNPVDVVYYVQYAYLSNYMFCADPCE